MDHNRHLGKIGMHDNSSHPFPNQTYRLEVQKHLLERHMLDLKRQKQGSSRVQVNLKLGGDGNSGRKRHSPMR
jgi:hypothetical protein